MATELGEVTTYKRLYLQFRDSVGKTNIFHNNGNDLVAKVNARILDYKSTDVMDV